MKRQVTISELLNMKVCVVANNYTHFKANCKKAINCHFIALIVTFIVTLNVSISI